MEARSGEAMPCWRTWHISAVLFALLLACSRVGDAVEEKQETGEESWLVVLAEYRPLDAQVELLSALLGGQSPTTWMHVPRSNPAMQFPTDFVEVRFADSRGREKAVERARGEPRVRYIVPNKAIASRDLLEWAAQEQELLEESPVSACNYGDFQAPQRFRTASAPSMRQESPDEMGSARDDALPDEIGETDIQAAAGRAAPSSQRTPPPWLTSRTAGSRRRLMSPQTPPVTTALGAQHLWSRGYTGQGVRVGVFDTGLSENHPHFRNIKDRTNWTNEKTLNDGVGHGTFVAGVIASQAQCHGFAPDAEIYVFRVFTNKQASFTAWFLDAFNYAIFKQIHLLNLSIGGPDFKDQPFVDKVLELSANNVIVISAIGNDGPLWGTLSNPADQMDVIGVGGVDQRDAIAPFSSRGMTGWEIPQGYGRVKPDIVTLSTDIRGSKVHGGCRMLSGTSVASPVAAGAVALLASTVAENERLVAVNPASIKQALLESAERVPTASIFEQGAGKLNLVGAFEKLQGGRLHASAFPARLDLTDCPYMWPFCTQPLYYGAQPLLVNLTVLNGISVASYFRAEPEWIPERVEPDLGAAAGPPQQSASEPLQILNVRFSYSRLVWPWSGALGVHIDVAQNVTAPVIVSGVIRFSLFSPERAVASSVEVPLRVRVISTPPRERRLLWDQFHNLRYPSGYVPRDNLDEKVDVLDWNGDHVHTNFREVYDYLRREGYFVEVLGRDYTCFDASQYGALLIVDSEEEFFQEELSKLRRDVEELGLSVVIFADWYNTEMMAKIRFFDSNTELQWTPVTGGANVPALNELVDMFGVALSDRVFKGDVDWGEGRKAFYATGSSITRFPAGGHLLSANLRDVTDPATNLYAFVPVLGLARSVPTAGGRLALFGDSNCLDMAHRHGPFCGWLLSAMLAFATRGELDKNVFPDSFVLPRAYLADGGAAPVLRMEGGLIATVSKVVGPGAAPACMPRPSAPALPESIDEQHERPKDLSWAGAPSRRPALGDDLVADAGVQSAPQSSSIEEQASLGASSTNRRWSPFQKSARAGDAPPSSEQGDGFFYQSAPIPLRQGPLVETRTWDMVLPLALASAALVALASVAMRRRRHALQPLHSLHGESVNPSL